MPASFWARPCRSAPRSRLLNDGSVRVHRHECRMNERARANGMHRCDVFDDDQNCTATPELQGFDPRWRRLEGRRIQSMEGCMSIKMNRPMKYALLAAVALSSLSSAAISLWPDKARAA